MKKAKDPNILSIKKSKRVIDGIEFTYYVHVYLNGNIKRYVTCRYKYDCEWYDGTTPYEYTHAGCTDEIHAEIHTALEMFEKLTAHLRVCVCELDRTNNGFSPHGHCNTYHVYKTKLEILERNKKPIKRNFEFLLPKNNPK